MHITPRPILFTGEPKNSADRKSRSDESTTSRQRSASADSSYSADNIPLPDDSFEGQHAYLTALTEGKKRHEDIIAEEKAKGESGDHGKIMRAFRHVFPYQNKLDDWLTAHARTPNNRTPEENGQLEAIYLESKLQTGLSSIRNLLSTFSRNN